MSCSAAAKSATSGSCHRSNLSRSPIRVRQRARGGNVTGDRSDIDDPLTVAEGKIQHLRSTIKDMSSPASFMGFTGLHFAKIPSFQSLPLRHECTTSTTPALYTNPARKPHTYRFVWVELDLVLRSANRQLSAISDLNLQTKVPP